MYIMWESGEKIGYRRKFVKLNKKRNLYTVYISLRSPKARAVDLKKFCKNHLVYCILCYVCGRHYLH